MIIVIYFPIWPPKLHDTWPLITAPVRCGQRRWVSPVQGYSLDLSQIAPSCLCVDKHPIVGEPGHWRANCKYQAVSGRCLPGWFILRLVRGITWLCKGQGCETPNLLVNLGYCAPCLVRNLVLAASHADNDAGDTVWPGMVSCDHPSILTWDIHYSAVLQCWDGWCD